MFNINREKFCISLYEKEEEKQKGVYKRCLESRKILLVSEKSKIFGTQNGNFSKYWSFLYLPLFEKVLLLSSLLHFLYWFCRLASFLYYYPYSCRSSRLLKVLAKSKRGRCTKKSVYKSCLPQQIEQSFYLSIYLSTLANRPIFWDAFSIAVDRSMNSSFICPAADT